ncbi:MAG: DUF7282 domain-containing protein, partial [Halapricum sp.]
ISGDVDYEAVDGHDSVEVDPDDDDDTDDVEINNENGTFQYDFEPTEDTESDGILNLTWNIEAQEDVNDAPTGESDTTGGPAAQNPVVEVYDRSGAELPEDEDSGNPILAKDVSNPLRIEAFPADSDDFTLPDGQSFGFDEDDPKSEDTAGTTTKLEEDVITEEFSEGQVGRLSVTPTGTGTAIMHLTDSVAGGEDSAQVTDLNGNDIVFDVLESNLEVEISLSDDEVKPGDDVNVSLTRQSNGEPLPSNVSVSLAPSGDSTIADALTNDDGEAVLTVPENASDGSYTVSTRPAGYAPNDTDLTVSSENETEEEATVDISSQSSESGDSVTVREAYLPDGGFIAIHDADGDIIGVSDYFESGTVEDVEVLLDTTLVGDEEVTAMPHMDDNDNQEYDFPDADQPYTDADDNPVTDTATIRSQAEPANFEVTELDAPSTVTQGDDVTASATVENTGDVEGTQTVEFRFDGETVAEEEITLEPGESVSDEFTVSTEGVDAGTYTHGLYTDDDSQTAQLTIEEEPTTTTTTTEEPDTTTTEEGDGGGPGFGIAVALVALLGAALLAVRRNN